MYLYMQVIKYIPIPTPNKNWKMCAWARILLRQKLNVLVPFTHVKHCVCVECYNYIICLYSPTKQQNRSDEITRHISCVYRVQGVYRIKVWALTYQVLQAAQKGTRKNVQLEIPVNIQHKATPLRSKPSEQLAWWCVCVCMCVQ